MHAATNLQLELSPACFLTNTNQIYPSHSVSHSLVDHFNSVVVARLVVLARIKFSLVLLSLTILLCFQLVL